MAISLNGITISGGTSLSLFGAPPVVFEGTNLTLVLPLAFAGSPNTFTSTNSAELLPLSFLSDTGIDVFTATTNSALPTTVVADTGIDVFTATTNSALPLAFTSTTVIVPTGTTTYGTVGSYTFTVPASVSSISAVFVGGGGGAITRTATVYGNGGGGGALRYTGCRADQGACGHGVQRGDVDGAQNQ